MLNLNIRESMPKKLKVFVIPLSDVKKHKLFKTKFLGNASNSAEDTNKK